MDTPGEGGWGQVHTRVHESITVLGSIGPVPQEVSTAAIAQVLSATAREVPRVREAAGEHAVACQQVREAWRAVGRAREYSGAAAEVLEELESPRGRRLDGEQVSAGLDMVARLSRLAADFTTRAEHQLNSAARYDQRAAEVRAGGRAGAVLRNHVRDVVEVVDVARAQVRVAHDQLEGARSAAAELQANVPGDRARRPPVRHTDGPSGADRDVMADHGATVRLRYQQRHHAAHLGASVASGPRR